MNGSNIFIDTNIAIYLLDGNDELAGILEGNKLYVSFISQLELLGFQGLSESAETLIEDLIDSCILIDINNKIKRLVIELRRKYRIKLPDAIVAASAIYLDIPLLSADTGFQKIEELHLILFEK